MDDGGLAAQPLHLDGLVGGQGRVLQGAGVEPFLIVSAGGGQQGEKRRKKKGGGRRKGNRWCYTGGQGEGWWWRDLPRPDPR